MTAKSAPRKKTRCAAIQRPGRRRLPTLSKIPEMSIADGSGRDQFWLDLNENRFLEAGLHQLKGLGNQAMGILAHHVNRELKIGCEGIVVIASDDTIGKNLRRQGHKMPKNALKGLDRIDKKRGWKAADPFTEVSDCARCAAGIRVVAHEGPGLNNIDWDFELASAQGFGETHA